MYFEEVSDANVSELEQINLAIFPIRYPPQVYKDVVQCSVSFLAREGDPGEGDPGEGDRRGTRPVGAVACRLEKAPDLGGQVLLYIITIGVLAPYRNAGLGAALLEKALGTVREFLPEVVLARLHVQVSNTDAIRFYEKHGFKVVETVENYYLRTEPRHAVVLELSLAGGDGRWANILHGVRIK
jgi:ribosomal protein S18 acetylase RimI-like enzyme